MPGETQCLAQILGVAGRALGGGRIREYAEKQPVGWPKDGCWRLDWIYL
ncbi:MAG: hypothetical protein KGZ70_01135 [Hydrogenophaga sp.]|nr:hypothetical protein [Hydrogenophaga sp.]